MKTKTFGGVHYVVVKYYKDEKGHLQMTSNIWLIAENAFRDCKLHKKMHGEDMAYVLKAKQCMTVE